MKIIGLSPYLIVSALLFVIGILGLLLNRKNIISILMSIELILLSANINFVSFSVYLKDMNGQVFSLFILAVAAAEVAIGLAIMVSYFKQRQNISVDELNTTSSEDL